MSVRPLASLVSLLLAATAMVGCKKEGQQAGGGASETGDIVIGHYGSLTGPEANFGISTENGIKLAVEERNAKGGVKGRKIRLSSLDDASKSDEVVNVVNRLIKQDKAVAILGEVASSRSRIGGGICQKAGVPMISPSSTNPQVTKIGDMVSRICFTDPFQGAVGSRFVMEKLGFKRGAVLFNRAEDYSTGLKDGFVTAFKKAGGTVTLEAEYAAGDQEFSAQLTKIKDSNPEFVYIPGYYTEIVTIAPQARRLGLNVPLIGGDGWVSEHLKNAGSALDNCYFSDHYAAEENRPEIKTFVGAFKAKYNSVPDSMAALGYDAANVLFDAMEKAKSLAGADLGPTIAATKDFKAVTGTITLDANRDAQKGIVVQKLMNGQFSLFWTADADKK